MEISYELKEEDFIDFNIYHAKNSPSVQRSILRQRIIGPVIFLLAAFIANRSFDVSLKYWLVLFGLASVLWFVFYPKLVYRKLAKKTKQIIITNPSQNIIGEKTILLKDGKIVEAGLVNNEGTDLSSIEKIVETEKHIFVYISSVSAFIIPIEAFENGESKNQFVEKIKENII